MNDMEKRIKDAFENAAPDVLDAVLARCTTQKGAVTPMKKKKNLKMRKFLNFTAAAAVIALLFGIGYVGAAVLMPDAPAGPYDNGQMNTPIETAPTNNATDPQPDIDIIPEPSVDDPIQTQPTDPDNTIGPMTQDEAVKLAMEDAYNYLITLNAFTGNLDEMDVFSVLFIDEYYRIVLHQEDCGVLNLQFQFVYFVNSFTGEVYAESVASNLDTVIGQVMLEKEQAIDIALAYLGLTRDDGEIEANLVADNTVWEVSIHENKRNYWVYVDAFAAEVINLPEIVPIELITEEEAIKHAVEYVEWAQDPYVDIDSLKVIDIILSDLGNYEIVIDCGNSVSTVGIGAVTGNRMWMYNLTKIDSSKDHELLGEQRAIEIAMQAAGFEATQVSELTADLNVDLQFWIVRFKNGTRAFTYVIDCYNGKILNRPAAFVGTLYNSSTVGYRGIMDEVKKHANIPVYENLEMSIKADKEAEIMHYDVQFLYRGYRYFYEISVDGFTLLNWSRVEAITVDVIGSEKALALAMEDAGISNTKIVMHSWSMTLENGKTWYSVGFDTDTMRYEYNIDAYTGEIISSNEYAK